MPTAKVSLSEAQIKMLMDGRTITIRLPGDIKVLVSKEADFFSGVFKDFRSLLKEFFR
jgi:hypothetical protein